MENTRFLGGEEFSLVHPSSSSCGIADGDRVTVTGGWHGNWVTRWRWSGNKLNIWSLQVWYIRQCRGVAWSTSETIWSRLWGSGWGKLEKITLENNMGPISMFGYYRAVTCEIPFSTFETRSRFLPPYHVVRDRDFSSLNLMFRDEIEIFHHWIS